MGIEVVLLNPNLRLEGYQSSAPPLGLATIAAVLEMNDIACDIMDPIPMSLSKEEVVRASRKYDVVGISCFTYTRFEAIDLINKIKDVNPDSLIVVGGPHATFLDRIWLEKVPLTDIVVRNEGEYSFLEICQGRPLEQIRGITYRRGTEIVSNEPRPPLRNLDSLPFLAYHKFPLGEYTKYVRQQYLSEGVDVRKHVPMVSSRGCPFGCLFCSSPILFGRFWRGMSPQRVVDEMEYVTNGFGVDYIVFFDDHFAFDPRRTIEICKEIVRRRLDVAWRCESRVDVISDKLVHWLSKAGCHLTEFGVESGSQRVIDRVVGKRIEIDQVRKAVWLCRKHGVKTKGFFIVPFPGEAPTDLMETIKVARWFDYAAIGSLEVYPGSRLWVQMKEGGQWKDELWFDKNNWDVFRYAKAQTLPAKAARALCVTCTLGLRSFTAMIYEKLRRVPKKNFI